MNLFQVAEGLDFANNYGRLVVMACIPYAPRNDAKTINKMLYLDDQKSKGLAVRILIIDILLRYYIYIIVFIY